MPAEMADADSPADRVRARLKHWLDVTKLGQRQFAADVGKTQVWLQKVLAGGENGNDVRLRDLDILARAMRTTASELVRSADEYYALELTPTELRIIEQLRRRQELLLAVATILGVGLPSTETPRHPPGVESGLRRRKAGRPRIELALRDAWPTQPDPMGRGRR